MSWGTCYKSSNNIHFNFPPLMNDSRNYSSYEVGASLDNKLKKEANIKTNSDYRKYCIQKGSIAIDGVSLTIAEMTSSGIKIAFGFTFCTDIKEESIL